MKTLLKLNLKIELQICIKHCAFSECGCCYNPRFYDLYGFSAVDRVVIQCQEIVPLECLEEKDDE